MDKNTGGLHDSKMAFLNYEKSYSDQHFRCNVPS